MSVEHLEDSLKVKVVDEAGHMLADCLAARDCGRQASATSGSPIRLETAFGMEIGHHLVEVALRWRACIGVLDQSLDRNALGHLASPASAPDCPVDAAASPAIKPAGPQRKWRRSGSAIVMGKDGSDRLRSPKRPSWQSCR